MTATAVYSQARANIESLRATATVVRARMKTTLEYAGTRVAQAEDAGGLLRFSLISLGTDANFVETNVSLIGSLPTVNTEPAPAETGAQPVGLISPMARPTDGPIAAATAPAANPPPVYRRQPAPPGEHSDGVRRQRFRLRSRLEPCIHAPIKRNLCGSGGIQCGGRRYNLIALVSPRHRSRVFQLSSGKRHQRQLHLVFHRPDGQCFYPRCLERRTAHRRRPDWRPNCFPHRRRLKFC